MLILIYLVSVLSQPNRVRSSYFSEVSPIESSQKLMLTVSTETPSFLDNLFSTTERSTTTLDNTILKTTEHIGTHPLFPIQEKTTSPMLVERTTEASFERETTAETSVVPNLESTTPCEDSYNTDEHNFWESTTESLEKETTQKALSQEDEQISTTAMMITTTTIATPHKTVEIETKRPPNAAEPDSLFIDNWSFLEQPINGEEPSPAVDMPVPLEELKEPAPDSFFINEEEDLTALLDEQGATIKPTPRHESHEMIEVPHSVEEFHQNHEDFHPGRIDKNKMSAFETPSIFSGDNLLNLFTFDHLPSNSNKRAVWWSKPNDVPVPEPTIPRNANNRRRQVNGIHPIYESEEVNESPRIFNQLFNRKFQDSMSLLERFFGNLIMQ